MDKKWLLGFIEAAGCFSVVIRKSKNKVGYQTTLDFTLKLPRSQEALLKKIHSSLGIGKLYSNKKEAILKATSIEDARKIAGFLKTQSFVSQPKKTEFKNWSKCLHHIEKGNHLSKEGILEIARLRDSVHARNLWNKKDYCALRTDIDPCSLRKKGKTPKGCRICYERNLP